MPVAKQLKLLKPNQAADGTGNGPSKATAADAEPTEGGKAAESDGQGSSEGWLGRQLDHSQSG